MTQDTQSPIDPDKDEDKGSSIDVVIGAILFAIVGVFIHYMN